MYLNHFGLNEPPFRITPVTEFFFSGANRGEILDALIYSICEVEGIVKVSGEVGSGKTMLCRMLLEKLPSQIESIYLANPSLSREEMLYAIADGLGLNINGERVGIIMQNIQNRLEEIAHEGKRVVVLVDEAHAMPPDTLEELRLLYNLQAGNAKLLQLVLFGQPELNAKLDQPNMRQLKDRIVHHFNMQPLSRNILESYLMFRMRAANYHGPNIFSPNAIKLIAGASNGLMRRVNILADKSLLAAFIENTHNIEARHVQAAMRDSDLKPARPLLDKKLLAGSVIAVLAAVGLGGWWILDNTQTSLQQATPAGSEHVQDSQPGPLAASQDIVPHTQPIVPQPTTRTTATQSDMALAAATGAAATVPPSEPAKNTTKTDISPRTPVGSGASAQNTRSAATAEPARATPKTSQDPHTAGARAQSGTANTNLPPAQNVSMRPEKSGSSGISNAEPGNTSSETAAAPVSKTGLTAGESSPIAPTAQTESGNPAAKEANQFDQRLETESKSAVTQ